VKTYKHIFFDLDHTLWDYEKNSGETLRDIHVAFQLGQKNINVESFLNVYSMVNHELWRAYNKAEITKDELRDIRFYKTLGHLGVKDKKMALALEDTFLANCSLKSHVLPNSRETLDYLKEKYVLHIITNGFKESTIDKLKHSNLHGFFKETITSECIGITKPNTKIFQYALLKAEAEIDESIMIGDNLETDILGAKKTGMDAIYYNPLEKAHQTDVNYEIKDLIELKKHL
jgi:putative hydrolase of the HAD superfamily